MYIPDSSLLLAPCSPQARKWVKYAGSAEKGIHQRCENDGEKCVARVESQHVDVSRSNRFRSPFRGEQVCNVKEERKVVIMLKTSKQVVVLQKFVRPNDLPSKMVE